MSYLTWWKYIEIREWNVKCTMGIQVKITNEEIEMKIFGWLKHEGIIQLYQHFCHNVAKCMY